MQVALNIAAVALCGCNQVWGLDATERDERKCPRPSEPGNLVFGRSPVEFVPTGRDARFYGIDEARTVAIAYGSEGGRNGVIEGKPDMALPMGFAFEISGARPRISPEGDELYIRTGMATYSLYTRNGTSWQRGPNLQGLSLADADILGTPTRRVDGQRRVLVSSSTMVREFTGDGTTWSIVDTYTRADLGTNSTIDAANFSADGLAFVFEQDDYLVLSVREDLASRFTAVRLIDVGALTPEHPYLTPDCRRIYFSDVTRGNDFGVYYADR